MIGMLTLKSWLENNYPFLTSSDIEFFKPWLVEKTIRKDEHLLVAGNCCRELSFLVSGLFRMYCISDGKEINMHFFFENDFVADYGSLLSQEPARYSIQALETSRVVCFSQEVLLEAYGRSKNWERLGRIMAERFACMFADRLETFLFMDGRGRYLYLMEENPQIFDRVPLYHLASYLGMERESLSRIRQRICRS
jgi:CRP-like cAMP-binding protein